ncbi:hypothetical protein EON77_06040, partial [bacterium]
MTLSRRDALVAAAAVGAGAIAGCARITPLAGSADGPAPTLGADERVLRRLTTEPTSADRALLRSEGHERFVGTLLRAEADEPTNLSLRLRHLDGIQLDPVTAMDLPKARILEDLQ